MTDAAHQQFNDSFASHMIRDFFCVLLAVIALELGIRFAMVFYDFHSTQKVAVENTAERLAADVKSIMLNEGGPVAARTVYPILHKDHKAIGMQIAIEPSPLTITAIQARFDFKPRGIPAAWPEGRFQEAVVEIRAEDFCIGCHITAGPGDVLGTVTVRRYLDAQLEVWWHEVGLAMTLGMSKIVLHTIVLFFLLRVRMASLLSLKSVVSVLAKAGSTISHRAPIRSHDEFGELARDLNLFLDRITHIAQDLGQVLTQIVALNQRLTEAQTSMSQRYEGLQAHVTQLAKVTMAANRATPNLDMTWYDAMRDTLSALGQTTKSIQATGADGIEMNLERLCDYLRACVDETQAARHRYDEVGDGVSDLSTELRAFADPMREMALIEAQMDTISKQGQTLLLRLRDPQQ